MADKNSGTNARSDGFSRRQVLQAFGAAAGAAALGALNARAQGTAQPPAAGGPGPLIRIVRYSDDAVASTAPVTWAIGQLGDVLRGSGMRLTDDADARAFTIFIGGMANDRVLKGANLDPASLPKTPESLVITGGDPRGSSAITVLGTDSRGLVYALTELSDAVRYSASPGSVLPRADAASESPANKVRGICRVFVSEMEDKPWYYDRPGWQKYLDMLATNRFNRFNLSLGLGYDFSTRVPDAYFFFAYPFFLDVPGYKVHVIDKSGLPLPDSERDKNLAALQFIADQCEQRGIHFQLGLWTHSISWPAAIANYTIAGISSQIQAAYSRDALHALLAACPNLKGVTIRTHGESGVPEGNFDLWKTIFTGTQGLRDKSGARRAVEIDLHAKGITHEIIDDALATGNPVTISPKFWAEHMGLPYMQASIRENEMPRARDGTGLMAISTGTRNFLRYGYGDLLKTDRKYRVIHRVFPGTQKLLLWGDPLFASEYGKNFGFSGCDGVEYMEPLAFKGREGSSWEINRSCYADASLKPKAGEYDWEKYAYTYRLLGRSAYNASDPNVTRESRRRLLKADYGAAADSVENALASASRILPLITVAHLPSAAHANYWPEIYQNMSLWDASNPGPYGGDTPSPKDFVHVSPLDPQIFASLAECAESLLAGKPLGKISPLVVAAQLEKWASDADAALADAGKASHPGERIFHRMAIDTAIVINLGRFFASKFRAAVFFAIFDQTGHAPALAAASVFYSRARDFWAKLVEQSAGVYVSDITFGEDPQLRGDWKGRLAAIEADLAALQSRQARNVKAGLAPAAPAATQRAAELPTPLALEIKHSNPSTFQPGKPVPLVFIAPGLDVAATATLWYRHVNQGEHYRAAKPRRVSDTFTAEIPAEYSQSDYPLQYYLHLAAPDASAGSSELLYPGFREDFIGQPYFIVQPA